MTQPYPEQFPASAAPAPAPSPHAATKSQIATLSSGKRCPASIRCAASSCIGPRCVSPRTFEDIQLIEQFLNVEQANVPRTFLRLNGHLQRSGCRAMSAAGVEKAKRDSLHAGGVSHP